MEADISATAKEEKEEILKAAVTAIVNSKVTGADKPYQLALQFIGYIEFMIASGILFITFLRLNSSGEIKSTFYQAYQKSN